MSFGFTPNVASDSRIFFAAEFQDVHSPGVSTDGTSSALIRLKSQLLSKLFMIVFSAHTLSSFTIFASTSFCFVALRTQIWSFVSGVRASTAIFSAISRIPAFLPKLMMSFSFSTLRIMPTPQVRWKTKLCTSNAMCFSKSLIASKTFLKFCVRFDERI